MIFKNLCTLVLWAKVASALKGLRKTMHSFVHSSIAILSIKVKVRSRRAVTALPSRKWPNATVPYVIGSNVTGKVIFAIN